MIFASGNPVQSGTLTILAGCDYKNTDGNAAVFTNTAGTWPNLTSATPYIVGFRGNQPVPVAIQPGTLVSDVWTQFPNPLLGPLSGTVVVATGAGQQVRFDLAADVTAITPNDTPNDLYGFAVFAQLASGSIVPLQTGNLHVLGVGS